MTGSADEAIQLSFPEGSWIASLRSQLRLGVGDCARFPRLHCPATKGILHPKDAASHKSGLGRTRWL
jgi:hypothetical protein